MIFKRVLLLSAAALMMTGTASAQQLRFDDVVRNLRNPDPKLRLSAVRLLRDAKYPEAVEPMVPLVLDPIDDIQLETIAAELSFFLEQDVKPKKMVGFVLEKRKSGIGVAAFDLGPLVVWPRPVPAGLVTALLQAVDDENDKVRLDAIYAAGVIAKAPLAADQLARLIKALDHYDPGVRAGAARVIGRLKIAEAGDALGKAVNDSQPEVRYAAMRALGAIRDTRAVGALTEQFVFYKKGEGAWSALEALGRIGAPASVPLFTERLQDKDPYLRRAAAEGLGRAGDATAIEALERNATSDESPMVRIAMALALQKLGRNYATRVIDLMAASKVQAQGQEYLIELGPSMAAVIAPRIQEPDPGSARRSSTCSASSAMRRRSRRSRRRRRIRTTPSRPPRNAPSRASRRQSNARREARTTTSVILRRSFYNRPTLDVARDLIGKVLVHETRSGLASGVIVEAEAYIGEADPACHAAPGPTKRNAPLYGPPGIAYVYLNYGVHYLVNAVTEAEGWPAAVLLRALEPKDGIPLMRRRRARGAGGAKRPSALAANDLCRGPGNLTKALGIDLRQNLSDLTNGALRIEDQKDPKRPVVWSRRIGLNVGVEPEWRVTAADSPAVSGSRVRR